MPKRRARRGRKPSIWIAAEKLTDIRRTLRSLGTEITRLQQRLRALDQYYSRDISQPTSKSTKTTRSGPNVRDLSYDVLVKARKGLPIRDLAEKVTRVRGNKSGQQFAQNLAVALSKDKRFKRVDRGVYALR